MANDPRRFIFKDCSSPATSKQVTREIKKSSNRGEFFRALRNVADLEVLNNIGLGSIGEGLRELVEISDSIRDGFPLPQLAGTSSESGRNWVLGTTGIAPSAVNLVGRLRPEIANSALAQAEFIFDRVQSGNFTTNQIGEVFSDLQNLAITAKGIFISEETLQKNNELELCFASAYASDFARSRAPKYKFMFVVEFVFNEPYRQLFTSGEIDRVTAFMVKSANRPNVSFEYEEVNLYNYKTKVIRRTTFEPVTLRFHDDNTNKVAEFYNLYIRSMSPITNLSPSLPTRSAQTGQYDESGMDFARVGSETEFTSGLSGLYSASVGALSDNNKTILNQIRIYHIFDFGKYMNLHVLTNPKITELQLDDLDMADSGSLGELSMTVAYDAPYMLTNIPLSDTKFPITELTELGTYPIRVNGSLSGGAGVTSS